LITPLLKSASAKNGGKTTSRQSRKTGYGSVSPIQGVFKQMLIGYVTGRMNSMIEDLMLLGLTVTALSTL
jgi:hypothetical protein